MNRGLHLKGLNGIRAIAAMTVVVSHVLEKINGFSLPPFKSFWDFSAYGVTMFFALSGFLITYLLLLEKAKFNTINIKNFYVRRILRIWPLYYLYFFIALLCTYLYFDNSIHASAWLYVFLSANIVNALYAYIPLLVHFWSLGVEEQFYLFWPWLVKLTNPLKSVLIFAICFFIVKLLFRVTAPESFYYQLMHITRFDCMAIGALGAILYYQNVGWFKQIIFNRIAQVCSWILLLLSAKLFLKLPDFIIHDIVATITVIIIINTAFNGKTLVNLENKLFDFLGKISFGIYVYHIMVIFLLQKSLPPFITSMPQYLQLTIIFSSVISVTVILAYLSYRFFETPFLRLRYKFSNVASHS